VAKEGLGLKEHIIPRDVTTRWNSTYDMLTFTLEYRHVVERFVADQKNNLRELELSEDEWKIVAQLSDVLMVGGYVIHGMYYVIINFAGSQTCHRILFKLNAKPRACNPNHGPYKRPPNCKCA
jgi:hypothetical protein